MTKIKICGLRRQEDIDIVNKYKPDFAGFIIDFPKSFRSIEPDKVKNLTQNLDKEIKPVGVFVDEEVGTVIKLLNDDAIEIAQLHGHESPEYIRKVQEETGKKVIKTFIIKTKSNNSAQDEHEQIVNKEMHVNSENEIVAQEKIANAEIQEILNEAKNSPADMILLDAGYGSGKTFDWSLIRDIGRPFFLAGGLAIENVSEAIEELQPYAVDISSSVEKAHYKDDELVRNIIEKVRWQG